ncbi:hypothetical protein N7448_010183 [Penicillium atrosanguineum]|uniref:Uncharacterized protein n=1 Tax=Penicillium atrosanguineum TaxID=1132637 RepID=A0A9W9PMV5_9EURO|nr:uncharacterized protein N7443_007407 [Penicillium atrosanguineum]KAJ5118476.1 hypothetical protein N7526_010113 [Penicillium atrosanguineum]KAJ5119514.1 hypothetical protein N7448_010183 [Penicillium atrosanguineum]KAJ5296514.1 hypothetical protein N7443_007407 [Penicillium atrosanguineum]KAJ5299278.1 hypothetical protein N7476_010835 [Penicillium atrosanguineum]
MSPYPYPPIPIDCVDSLKSPSSIHSPRELVLVSRTNSDEWGPPDEAAAKALQATVSLGSERLLRTHHRSLAPCTFVFETEVNEKIMWVVSIGPYVPMYDTHAGGREIHFRPEHLLPQISQVYSGSRQDPLQGVINPRRFLPAAYLESLRRFFPAAIGARVFIAGYLVVLFRSQRDIEASWLEGCVPSFGLLRLGYAVAVHYPAETLPESESAVTKSPEQTDPAASLGLKLEFTDGSQGICVPTHAFVDVNKPQDNPNRKRASLLEKTKAMFSIATVMKVKESLKVGAAVNSSLGKSMWLGQPKEKIGHITSTFDQHIARSSAFPETIGHDISIVTGGHLPKISTPPRAPEITSWGDYGDALEGQFAFAMALGVRTEKSKEVERDALGKIQKAVVEGAEYLWDRKTRTQSAALLWRTLLDGAGMEVLPGSVLCLGQRTDPCCRAVLFKNFETPMCPQHFESDSTSGLGDAAWSSIKGGFLLPTKIRGAEIICESEKWSTVPDNQILDVD